MLSFMYGIQTKKYIRQRVERLSVFWNPIHSRVTAVARKRPLTFCPKCRWQVTAAAKYAYTLRISEALHEITWCTRSRE